MRLSLVYTSFGKWLLVIDKYTELLEEYMGPVSRVHCIASSLVKGINMCFADIMTKALCLCFRWEMCE